MKTDVSIYEFLATGAEAFRILSGGLTLSGAYQFRSLTIKGIERRLDGIFEPDGHGGPVFVVEFNGQFAHGAWYNLLTKIGLYGEQHPARTLCGLLVFLRRGDDPGVPVGLAHPLNQVAYLEELLPSWAEREPENPFVAVFAPLLIRDDAALRASLPMAWRRIQEAPLAPAVQATLERMLEFWLIERFPTLSSEELGAMLNVLVPLEETRAYQEIFAKGEALGKADSLQQLLTHRFGTLPHWALRRLDTADIAQLDRWLEASFEAQTLENVMGPAPKRKPPDKP